jgi:hypothetical protein
MWAAAHATALPEPVATELRRIGIDPAQPAELYVLWEGGASLGVRLGYFAVGRILSGPVELLQRAESGAGRFYAPVQTDTGSISLAVAYQETLSRPPDWIPPELEPLLAIDFFVDVPRTRALDALRRPVGAPGAAV